MEEIPATDLTDVFLALGDDTHTAKLKQGLSLEGKPSLIV